MPEQLAWIVPLVAAVGTTAYSGISSHQQKVEAHKEAREERARSAAQWEELSKPNPAALEAAATQNRGQLAQARLGSYQNLASNLASRGFGAGSGIGYGAAQNIEQGYLQGLGQSSTELTKFGLTPQFAPPSGVYASPGVTPTAGGAMAGTGANLLGSAYGWTMMKNLFGNQTPTINLNYPYTTTNPYGISYDYGKPMSFQNFAY